MQFLLQVLALQVASISVYFLAPLVLRKTIKDRNGNPLPPGPFLRYFHLRNKPELTLDAWAKQYGPLFSFWVGSQHVAIISDAHVAKELMIVNGATFSSRKSYFVKAQTILHNRAITGSPYGNRWKQHRRIVVNALTQKVISGNYGDAFDNEAHAFVLAMYNDSSAGELPISTVSYVVRYVLNNMLTIAFGTRTYSVSDPLVAKSLSLSNEFVDLSGPFSNTIDFIEPLQWLPTRTRARARKLHEELMETYGGMVLDIKVRLDAGESVPDCIVKTLLETQAEEKLDWEDICMLASVFPLGGLGSGHMLLNWFLAVMPSYPEVQKRAHEELDRVVGSDRLPTVEDEYDLPYVRAIIKEVQRLQNPSWIPPTHLTTEDFTYNGMYLPKGSLVALNLYTLHHNEDRYPDPYSFNPERYIQDHLSCADSAKLPNPLDRDHWTFGAGRRFCPGIHAAERELWLAFSTLLWAFRFDAIPGVPIPLDEYKGTSGRLPLPFKIAITPRFDKLGEVLRERGKGMPL